MAPSVYTFIAVSSETPIFRFIWVFWTRFGKGKIWRHAHAEEFTMDSLDALIADSGFMMVEYKLHLVGMVRAAKVVPRSPDSAPRSVENSQGLNSSAESTVWAAPGAVAHLVCN